MHLSIMILLFNFDESLGKDVFEIKNVKDNFYFFKQSFSF